METTIIAALLKLGAPWILAAAFLVLFIAERKKKDQLADKLFELGMAITSAVTEFQGTLHNVERDLEDIKRRQL